MVDAASRRSQRLSRPRDYCCGVLIYIYIYIRTVQATPLLHWHCASVSFLSKRSVALAATHVASLGARQQNTCAATAHDARHDSRSPAPRLHHGAPRSSLNSSWRLLLAGAAAAAAAAGTSFQIDMVCSLSWCSCSCSWRSSGAAWRLVATLAKLLFQLPPDGALRFWLLLRRQSLLQGEHIGALLLRDVAFHFGPPLRRWLRNVRAARRLALLRCLANHR
jgi:hypothetical protein